MAGNLVKSVMLKIVANDGDTEEKLDKITAKAEELSRLHPELTPRVNTAAASAKLAVLRKELKDTGKDADETGGRFAAFKDGINVLTLGLSGGVGEMGMFEKVMWAMNIATGLGEPLVAGLTVAVGGLSSGLVAAGAGLGVFAVVAKSVWSGVSTNITAATAAEDKMATAKNLKQQTADAKQFEAALKGLPAGERQLVIGAANAESGWHSFVRSAASGVSSVLVPALGLVPRVLQLMQGFLPPVESALRGVVTMVGKGLNSAGFSSFIGMLQRNAGPMISKLAVAIGHVVVGIGGILRAFMPVAQGIGSGLDSITAKFAKWGTTLSGHSGFQSLMSMFRSETPLAVSALKSLAGIAKTVVASMSGMSTFSNSKMLLQLAVPVLKFVDALLKAHPELVWLVLYLKLAADAGGKLKVAFAGLSGAFTGIKSGVSAVSNLRKGMGDAEAAASEATGTWGTFGGKLSNLGGMFQTAAVKMGLLRTATIEGTEAQEGLDVAMEANPVGLIVTGIALVVAAIVILTIKFKFMRDFWKAAWADIKATAVAAFHILEDAVKVYVAIWTAEWNIAKTIVMTVFRVITDYIRVNVDVIKTVLSWFGRLAGLFRGWWDDAFNAQVSVVSRMISFVRGIPGKILSGLADLGSMLYDAGAHAISELISGLSSGIGKIGSVMGGIASKIAGFIGLSPAKEGPLSGGGAPRIRGMHIGQDVAAGMMDGLPRVRSAAMQLAGAVSGAAAGGRGPSPAGGDAGSPLVIEIHPPAGAAALGPEFMTALANGIRTRGGDPRILQRKVVFA